MSCKFAIEILKEMAQIVFESSKLASQSYLQGLSSMTHTCSLVLHVQVDFVFAFSCLGVLQEGSWRSGHCHGHNLADSDRVWAAIDDSLQNKAGSSQRLYFLDGTFPGDLPEGCSIHEDVPGECLVMHMTLQGSGVAANVLRLALQDSSTAAAELLMALQKILIQLLLY